MNKLFLLLFLVGFVSLNASCAHVARLSDFSMTSVPLDFDSLSKQNYDVEGSLRNEQTEYEYFVEVEKATEDALFNAIINALTENGYRISYSDKLTKSVIGERGLRFNEWKSISGVYYRLNENIFQVYFKNAITQDITGGWRENRARKLAVTFCTLIKTCKKSIE